jgi:hypothetical protein
MDALRYLQRRGSQQFYTTALCNPHPARLVILSEAKDPYPEH